MRWKGFETDDDEDTWEARTNIHPEAIKEYELQEGLFYDHEWLHRCDICDLPCNSVVGVTIQKGHAHKNEKV